MDQILINLYINDSEKNDNNQKYLVYTYKADYTKPKITTYYYCLKTFVK